ncbi:amino acid transporter AVT1D-like [Penaeus japonicus]|uniref:amino acid transporter AVT1D-like n=1 Tax=Penaeus japonicus TaxID=27405 RepID=UPI001C70CCD3|nr:amino acid transporter AVT1D-like [Penaeus japonicus]
MKSEKSWLLEGWRHKFKKASFQETAYGPVSTNTAEEDTCGSLESSLTSSGHHGRANNGLGLLFTSFFLVAQVAGLGVLALPWAVAQTGWGGMGLLAGSCLVVGFSACHLGHSWIILEERWPEYQRACRKPYPAMAYRTLGMFGWHLVNIVQCVTLFGVSTVTILLSAQLLASVLETVLPQLTVCSWIIACGCALVPLSWLGSPKDFWQASVLAMIAVIAAIVVVIVKVVVEAPGFNPDHPAPTFSSFFLGFGTIMFSYGGAVTFPTIQNDMSDRSKFPVAVMIAFAALMVLYLPVAALGYLEFGNSVEVNILLSVHGVAVQVTRVLMLVNNAFTYILVVNPLSQSLEEALGLPNAFGWRRCILRTTIVGAGIVISLAVQNFGKILNLIGSFSVPLLTFILPPIFYMRLCDSKENGDWQTRHIHWSHRTLLWSVVLIGLVTTVAATWSAMTALLAPGQYEGTCFDSV